MNEIHERLRFEAEREFGSDRAREIQAFLEQTALDLEAIANYPLDGDDGP
jgi:hypothetical protein